MRPYLRIRVGLDAMFFMVSLTRWAGIAKVGAKPFLGLRGRVPKLAQAKSPAKPFTAFRAAALFSDKLLPEAKGDMS
jgi:hypothetical protein